MSKKIIGITVGTPIKPSEASGSATFIPSVSSDGVLSWTNDKGLENPTPVNVKGIDGKNGKDGQDYILTEADKQEIADMVDVPDIEADLSDYAKKEYVDDTVGDVETALDEIIEIQESLKDGYTGGVSKEYVDDNYVSMELLNQIVGVLEENYATKQYVEDYINEALGGEY